MGRVLAVLGVTIFVSLLWLAAGWLANWTRAQGVKARTTPTKAPPVVTSVPLPLTDYLQSSDLSFLVQHGFRPPLRVDREIFQKYQQDITADEAFYHSGRGCEVQVIGSVYGYLEVEGSNAQVYISKDVGPSATVVVTGHGCMLTVDGELDPAAFVAVFGNGSKITTPSGFSFQDSLRFHSNQLTEWRSVPAAILGPKEAVIPVEQMRKFQEDFSHSWQRSRLSKDVVRELHRKGRL